jgi:hypothetical protein
MTKKDVFGPTAGAVRWKLMGGLQAASPALVPRTIAYGSIW